MTEEIRRAYEILDLQPGAGASEVREAYLDLVKVWHPDRHQSEPERLRRRAEQKLKEITAAYERLRAAASGTADADLIPMDFGGLWGFVNAAGATVIHPEYLAARAFREGLAAVRLVEKWGFVDTSGEMRITPLYEECGDFSEGLAAVRWYGRWGYIGRTGSFVIQPRFQEAGPFRGGRAEVRLGSRTGFVGKSGEVEFHRHRLGETP
jgi:hypothetical protein